MPDRRLAPAQMAAHAEHGIELAERLTDPDELATYAEDPGDASLCAPLAAYAHLLEVMLASVQRCDVAAVRTAARANLARVPR